MWTRIAFETKSDQQQEQNNNDDTGQQHNFQEKELDDTKNKIKFLDGSI